VKKEEQTRKYRTTRYIFYKGFKGKILTDSAGRSSAVKKVGVCFPTGEEEVVEVQMYKDPVIGWQPMGGLIAVEALARRQRDLHRIEKTRKSGKIRGKKIQETKQRNYELYRQWFRRHLIENPSHSDEAAVRVAAEHFNVSQKTINRATEKERQRIIKEVKPS
jgi:hypothetical protein